MREGTTGREEGKGRGKRMRRGKTEREREMREGKTETEGVRGREGEESE